MHMADDSNLPEGTDTIIAGAANTGAVATDPVARDETGGTVTIESTADVIEREIISDGGAAQSALGRSGGEPAGTLSERLRGGRDKLSGQAGEKARGIVTQGLERTAEALANVSRMIGDTASGIEERLGAEYGDYARRAAGAIENTANTIAEKDPDELIDDTRTFVRNSPGVALAAAAVVGFAVARLVKSGLAPDTSEDDREA
jgi:ElaB/YqjD/DUF883 family membrane-anchored ribosome-binding protein